ncbi:MAG: YidC/Oxa1 family membrane protein insertase, partial [Ruminococcus sp.]|nr:YidC/Oxa1 family membrane protein insertase [Ruminococcus sp.]
TERYFAVRPEIYIVRAVKEHPELFSGLPTDFVDNIIDFNNKLFGFIDLGQVPSFNPEGGWSAAAVGLIMIPFLSGLAQLASSVYMYIRQKKMQAAGGAAQGAEGMQKNMMNSMNIMLFVMPAFSVYIAIGYPAAIGFYWTCSALIGFLQSVLLNKIYTPEYVAKLVEKDKLKKKDKNKKRSAAFERYQQMLAEQNGTAAPEQKRITVSGKLKSDDDDEDLPDPDHPEKISKSKQRDIERKLINEARRRQAEKYGEDYTED